MAAQIARKGRTVTVEIPEDVLHKANLSVGDAVEWSVTSPGSLSLRSSRHSKTSEMDATYNAWASEEIQAGLAELDAGKDAPSEKVIEWLQSWGSKRELPTL